MRTPRRSLPLSFACTLALGAACDAGPEPAGSTSALFALPAAGTPPYYGTSPFPGDAWLDGTGHVQSMDGIDTVAPDADEVIAAQMARLDGFSTRPTLEIFLDGPLDPSSLPRRSVDLDAPVFVLDAAGSVVPFDFQYDQETRRIAGSPVPGVLLEPGERYAFFGTNRLRGPDGPVAVDPDFARFVRADPSTVPSRWRTTRAAVDLAVRVGVARGALVAASAFRVERARDVLLRAREKLELQPAPSFRFHDPAVVFVGAAELDTVLGTSTRDGNGDEIPGWDNPTGLAHDHVAALGTGRITTVRFRRYDASGVAGYYPDSGTFELDDTGEPIIVDPAFEIPLTVALPKGPMPADGFPVVLYGHGLSASRHQMLMMMDTITEAGYAALAIDASSQGSRYEDVDERNNLPFLLPSFSGDPSIRDGFGDVEGFAATLQLFHRFLNVAAMRDEMRQTALDWSQVVRLANSPALDLSALGDATTPQPKLDGSRMVYMGESYGGVIGSLFTAIEPHLDASVLNVPGGGFVDLCAAHSPTLRGLIDFSLPGTFGAAGTMDRFHPIFGLGNALLDGADPIVFAPVVLHRASLGVLAGRPRDVLVLESIGDEIMANLGTEALAQAMGLGVLGPSYQDVRGLPTLSGEVSGNIGGRTGLLLQFSPASHGENWSRAIAKHTVMPFALEAGTFESLPAPVLIRNPVRQTRALLGEVLENVRNRGVLRIDHPAPPVHDFDDDGILDDVDPSPYGQ